jgi:hypothetical protein
MDYSYNDDYPCVFVIHKDHSYNDEARDHLKDGIWDEEFGETQTVFDITSRATSLKY